MLDHFAQSETFVSCLLSSEERAKLARFWFPAYNSPPENDDRSPCYAEASPLFPGTRLKVPAPAAPALSIVLLLPELQGCGKS